MIIWVRWAKERVPKFPARTPSNVNVFVQGLEDRFQTPEVARDVDEWRVLPRYGLDLRHEGVVGNQEVSTRKKVISVGVARCIIQSADVDLDLDVVN